MLLRSVVDFFLRVIDIEFYAIHIVCEIFRSE